MSRKAPLLAAALIAASVAAPASAVTISLQPTDTWTIYDVDNFASYPMGEERLAPVLPDLWFGAPDSTLAPGTAQAEGVAPEPLALAAGRIQFLASNGLASPAISAVPEPSALLAFLAGLGVMAGALRRFRS